ncbi:helix-turn-helix transcriptional regulator [Intrasporangium mesophilum]
MVPKSTQGRGTAKPRSEATELGRRLRAARRDQAMTLRDVFEQTGVSITYLSDLERGVLSNPTLDKVRQIALALNITVEDLLGPSETSKLPTETLPEALTTLLASPQFESSIEADAKSWRTTPEALERAWRECLKGISVDGRRPRSAMDYLFIFEAIRRAIDK